MRSGRRPAPVVATFDVFDTVVTRAVAPPEAIFLLVGNHARAIGMLDVVAADFSSCRLRAGNVAHEKAARGTGRATLEDIYRHVGFELGLDEDAQKRLFHLELAVERHLLRSVQSGVQQVVAARALGQKVVFVSDMYIDAETLGRWLAELGIRRDDEPVFVSSEFGRTKRRGLLRLVAKNELTPSRMVLHTGNDVGSDIRPARRDGLRARLLHEANDNAYEAFLGSFTDRTGGLAAAFAGASKAARLSIRASGTRAVVRDGAAGVAAPALVGYALWVLDQSAKLDIDRLYFLSRDGQVIQRVAEIVAPRIGSRVELRYLYCSRSSIALPALGHRLDRYSNLIWGRAPSWNIREFLGRVQIRPDDVSKELKRLGFGKDDCERHLSTGELRELYDALTHGPLRQAVIDSFEQSRPSAIGYLRSSGFFSGERVGIVDIGGAGSQLTALSLMREEYGLATPTSFLVKRARPDARLANATGGDDIDIRSWLPRPARRGFRDGTTYPLELFCAADHGSVTSYSQGDDGVFYPVLTSATSPAAQDARFDLLRGAIERFAAEVVLNPDLVDVGADMSSITFDALQRFWREATRAESSAWGSFPIDTGSGHATEVISLASPYTSREVIASAMSNGARPGHGQRWPGGSYALSPVGVRALVRAGVIARGLTRRAGLIAVGGQRGPVDTV